MRAMAAGKLLSTGSAQPKMAHTASAVSMSSMQAASAAAPLERPKRMAR